MAVQSVWYLINKIELHSLRGFNYCSSILDFIQGLDPEFVSKMTALGQLWLNWVLWHPVHLWCVLVCSKYLKTFSFNTLELNLRTYPGLMLLPEQWHHLQSHECNSRSFSTMPLNACLLDNGTRKNAMNRWWLIYVGLCYYYVCNCNAGKSCKTFTWL